jgi:plasmid replication initiation protein
MARISPKEGNGKSRGLRDIQSTLRADLAGIKKRLPEHVAKEPANIGLRSQYSIRLYGWAKKYASVGKKRISLEDLRKVLGLEPVKDAENNIIQEAPLSLWANFRQRAFDIAILGINEKTDLKIEVEYRWKDQSTDE